MPDVRGLPMHLKHSERGRVKIGRVKDGKIVTGEHNNITNFEILRGFFSFLDRMS